MQKIVFFLDIDGPIVSQRCSLAGMKADPIAVHLVNELFQQPNVEVALSSTFRNACQSAEDATFKLHKKYGIEVKKFHKEWRTGAGLGCDKFGRSLEIQEWLLKNKEADTIYAALDDDPINIPDVIHIKADYNGIPSLQLIKMKALYDEKAKKRVIEFTEWLKTRVEPSDLNC